MTPVLRTNPIGKTGLQVTALGFGTAALGWLFKPVQDEDARAALARARELGIRFFDSSPLYGSGVAESRVGRVLPEWPRDKFVLSTKVGYAVYPDSALPDGNADVPILPPPRDYSYDGAMRIIEGSLKRMNTDRIDILLIHDPDDHMDECLRGTYKALRKLRDEGVVKAIGAGMNRADLLAQLARSADFDCFLMAGRYTLLDQSALAELLPLAAQKGIAIYIGGPFNSGILANPYAEGATFNYMPAAREWVEKARRMDAVCRRHGVSLQAAAIQFPLGHPAVCSVLTGARSVVELEQNVAAFQTPVPAELWEDLRREMLIDAHTPTPGASHGAH